MKMFRPALVGALPAFILLVCVQLNARATCIPPPPLPEMQSWFSGDNTTNGHIWQPVGTLYNHATDATAKGTAPSQVRQLFFADRVTYQRAIEEVYWRHRIWPKERPDPKPSLAAVMSQAAIEKKVQDYLRNSELLEQEWQKPITPEQLQAEMDRMAQHSKQPEVLRELFAALGDDPFVIAECLARPVLLERLQFAKAERREEPLESWSARAQEQMPNVMATATASHTLPGISDQPSDCIDDGWTATSTTNAPTARLEHTAVWTGSEMIVWGGTNVGSSKLNTGGRYNPSTDSWAATSTTNAPGGRHLHTAVWTGSEMIVWGGLKGNFTQLNTGGRYNPGTDSWTATSTTNAPTGRFVHTAVWTGSEMIVWGGTDGGNAFSTGGRYDPSTNSWTATTTTNAPPTRWSHTAVWTGSEMIVWGGSDGQSLLNTGGRYNPSTDTWTATATTNAPDQRVGSTAVWTGSEMIIWGGTDGNDGFDTGGRYNPGTDSWTATSTTNVPIGRVDHTAVWTGSEMIVWGGLRGIFTELNTGGRYNPSTDSWTATSTTNAPIARSRQKAVWTGTEMIVWGGGDGLNIFNTGGRYCAQGGSPTITLDTAARKVAGINTVGLTWSGATSTDIDVYRDSVLIVTTANDGSYRDSTGDTGRARYTYQVCEAGTQACSNEASVAFLR
jgi:N-acetylneuraminic acid mutarotase